MSINKRIEQLERKLGIRDQAVCSCPGPYPEITEDMAAKEAAQIYFRMVKESGRILSCKVHGPKERDDVIAKDMTQDEASQLYKELFESTRIKRPHVSDRGETSATLP